MAENKYIGVEILLQTGNAQEKLDQLTTNLKILGEKIEEQNQKVASSKKAWQDAAKLYGDTSAEVAKLKKEYTDEKIALTELEKLYRKNKSVMVDLEVGETKAAKSTRKFSDELKRSITHGATLGTVLGHLTSRVLFQLSASMKKFASDIIEEGKAYEVAFTEVRKTVDATEEAYQRLSKTIQDMSLVMPSTASEIAEVVALGGQLGIATEALDVFAETAIRLGVSTNLSATEAGESMARFANIMRTNQQDFDRIGSTLVELGNNFATTESEILNMAKSMASIGNQVGLSESQVIGFATALSSLGLETERGSSALTKFFAKVNTAVATGSEELVEYAKVAGMTIEEFSKLGTADASIAFIQGLARIKEGGGDLIDILTSMGITEVRVRDAVLRLASNTDLLSRAVDMANDAWTENNALVEESSKFFNTLDSQIKMMKNSFSYLKRSIYDAIEEPLKNGVKALTSFIDSINGQKGASEKLSVETSNLVTVLNKLKEAEDRAKESTDALTQSQAAQVKALSFIQIAEMVKQAEKAYQELENLQKERNKRIKEQAESEAEYWRLVDLFGGQGELGVIFGNIKNGKAHLTSEQKKAVLPTSGMVGTSPLAAEKHLINIVEKYGQGLEFLSLDEQILSVKEAISESVFTAVNLIKEGLVNLEDFAGTGLVYNLIKDAFFATDKIDTEVYKNYTDEVLEMTLEALNKSIGESEDKLDAQFFSFLFQKQIVTEEMASRAKAIAESTDYIADTIRDDLQDNLDELDRYYAQLEANDANLLEQRKAEYNLWAAFLKTLTSNETERLIETGEYTREQVDAWIEETLEHLKRLSDEMGALSGGTTSSKFHSSLSGGSFFSNMLGGERGYEEFKKEAKTIEDILEELSAKSSDLLQDIGYWFEEIGSVISDVYDLWLDDIENRINQLEENLEELLAKAEEYATLKIAETNAMYQDEALSEKEYIQTVEEAQAEALAAQYKAQIEYNKKLAALEAEKEEAERKQFYAEQANSIASTLIAGAQAIMAAWAEGPIVGAVMTTLLSALTATQVGIIASQKYSAYAQGGIIDKPTMALMGEEGKEAVLPLENNTGWLNEIAGKITEAMYSENGSTSSYADNRTVEFNQVINSPQSLTRREIYKDTKQLLKQIRRA